MKRGIKFRHAVLKCSRMYMNWNLFPELLNFYATEIFFQRGKKKSFFFSHAFISICTNNYSSTTHSHQSTFYLYLNTFLLWKTRMFSYLIIDLSYLCWKTKKNNILRNGLEYMVASFKNYLFVYQLIHRFIMLYY